MVIRWWTNILPWKMAIEIVDFPIKNGGSFHGKMLVHQMVNTTHQYFNVTLRTFLLPRWKVGLGSHQSIGVDIKKRAHGRNSQCGRDDHNTHTYTYHHVLTTADENSVLEPSKMMSLYRKVCNYHDWFFICYPLVNWHNYGKSPYLNL